MNNQFAFEFIDDVRNFFNHTKTDFINEQGQFGQEFIEHLTLDEDVDVFLQQVTRAKDFVLEVIDQVGLGTEKLLQDYMNKYIIFVLLSIKSLLTFIVALRVLQIIEICCILTLLN